MKHEPTVMRGKIADKLVKRDTIRLPVTLMSDLRHEARRRGTSPDEMAVALLKAIVSDQLFGAVLDR